MKHLLLTFLLLCPSLLYAQATVNITATDVSTGARTNVGDATNDAVRTNCVSGCSAATTDTDDGSIAGGQAGVINLAFSNVWDGSVWRRFTVGTAGTAAAQVVTVQGIASMTPLLTTATQSGTWNVTTTPAGIDTVNINNVSTVDTDDGSIASGQASIALVAGLQMYYNGTAWVRVRPNPCSDYSLLVTVPVNISTATTTEIINGSGASNFGIICGINLVSALANNVALVEDDTDNCASPSAGMLGGTTAASGLNFGANGGEVAMGGGGIHVAKTSVVNRYVCLITSAATQLSGVIIYALAP